MWRIFIGVRIEVILFIEYCAVSVIVLISYCVPHPHTLYLMGHSTQTGQAGKVQSGINSIYFHVKFWFDIFKMFLYTYNI